MKGNGTHLQARFRVTPSQAVLPPDEEFGGDEEWSQFLEEDQRSQLVRAQHQQCTIQTSTTESPAIAGGMRPAC